MPNIELSWIRLEPSDGGVLNRQSEAIVMPEGARIEQALEKIGYMPEQVALLIQSRAVSIFGQYATSNLALHTGDRIEILDKLRFNPMESRRRRAAHKQHHLKGVRKSGLALPK